MSHVPVYEQIYAEWKRNPNVNQSELCRKKGVKVGSYMAWKGKTKKPPAPSVPKVQRASSPKSIMVEVGLYDIVAAVQKNKDLTLNIEKLVLGLKPEHMDALQSALGAVQLSKYKSPEDRDGEGHGGSGEYPEESGELALKS